MAEKFCEHCGVPMHEEGGNHFNKWWRHRHVWQDFQCWDNQDRKNGGIIRG